MKMCAWCHSPMDDTKRRRTCSTRCRKALSREMKQARRSNYTRASSVTPGDDPYAEPPRPGESFYRASAGDERFKRQLARDGTRAQPLTDEERTLLARQCRNPGPLLPELQQRLLDHELERMRLEAAEYHQAAIKVEDRFDPSSWGSVAARAIQSRQRNKPIDPNLYALRPPAQPGHRPTGDLPQCVNAPWSRG